MYNGGMGFRLWAYGKEGLIDKSPVVGLSGHRSSQAAWICAESGTKVAHDKKGRYGNYVSQRK